MVGKGENEQRKSACALEKIKRCGMGVSLGEGGQGRLLFPELSPEMTWQQGREGLASETGVRWDTGDGLCCESRELPQTGWLPPRRVPRGHEAAIKMGGTS